MALTYPKKYEKDIDPETWDTAIIDPANAEQQDLNGFLLHRTAHYKDSEYNDTMLWQCMKEDFVGWTKETWVPAKKDIVRDFRNFLRENGVFVPMDGGVIGDNIQEQVLDAKEEHEWTPQEIEHQLRTMKKLNSRWNPSNTPPETRSNSIAPGTSPYVPHPSLPPLSSVPQYPPIQPATSTTAPQLEQAQDPLASRFNNLRTLPQQDQVPRPVPSSSTSPLQPAMQFPPTITQDCGVRAAVFGGFGRRFTQPRTPEKYHVPGLAVGHRVIVGAKELEEL